MTNRCETGDDRNASRVCFRLIPVQSVGRLSSIAANRDGPLNLLTLVSAGHLLGLPLMESSRRPRARLHALVALSLTLVVLGQVPDAWGGSGHIITVAGSGAPGLDGDGGPATSAQLRYPSSVAIDAAGNLFIADTINNRIREVAAGTGIITTVAGTGATAVGGGGGPATSAPLSTSHCIAGDAAGNLFIADANN